MTAITSELVYGMRHALWDNIEGISERSDRAESEVRILRCYLAWRMESYIHGRGVPDDPRAHVEDIGMRAQLIDLRSCCRVATSRTSATQRGCR